MKVREIAHSEGAPGDLGEGRLQKREGILGWRGQGGGRGGRRRAQSPALDLLGWGAWQASPEAGWCLK